MARLLICTFGTAREVSCYCISDYSVKGQRAGHFQLHARIEQRHYFNASRLASNVLKNTATIHSEIDCHY